jgi:NADH-quinone oxidoreductase subunit F
MKTYRINAMVCAGTGCVSGGAFEVMDALRAEVEKQGLSDEVEVVQTGCNGFCARGPILVVYPDGIFYEELGVEDIPTLVEEHFLKGRPYKKKMYVEAVTKTEIPKMSEINFFGKQVLVALRNRGLVDPEAIDEYIARDGYRGTARALEMTPDEIIKEVLDSGLRGRGGGGFPTGLKWKFCAANDSDEKFILCNADEGDPGAFMDRSLLEADPHAILEGMTIGARAIGAKRGYIYVRAEYPLAIDRLNIAIEQATEYGLLGENILDSGMDFHLELYMGAGAFVCGEETALMTSIEGKRGMPRPRPPFPAHKGLWQKPSVLNNVETLANIPQILHRGAAWYASLGTEKSRGTKVFALTGSVVNTGLVEVPMGIPLREIIFDVGGGITEGREFKGVQMGGPSGGTLPESLLDTPVDYESIVKTGAIMGSGGMVVMDETTCMVDLAKFFLTFTADESCGKCTPCRVGTQVMLEILDRITRGEGKMSDLDLLEAMGQDIINSSLCGLGQTAPNPVLTTMKYYREEYEAHILHKTCPAGVCRRLTPAPCQRTCPIGQDVPTYVALIALGRFADAYEYIRMDNPIPLSLGRVCVHHCEDTCKRAEVDKAIAICALKRFCADVNRDVLKRLSEKVPPPNGKKVAVVGAGPAGLSVANDLALLGYKCTIFEELPVSGGMLVVGIPEYRLPRNILAEEIDGIRNLGVEIQTGVRIGRDRTLASLQEEFDAVFLGVGAHKGLKLNIEGESDSKGVMDCTTLLRDRNLGRMAQKPGDKVVVIGGGNAAMDAVRTSVRLGCKEVSIVYRRTEAEMPANPAEIVAAKEEGVKMVFLASPVAVVSENGKVTGLRCIRNELGEPDRSGRRRPVPVEGSEYVVPCDLVVPAISQEPDLSFLGENHRFGVTRWNTFEVDPTTLQTEMKDVFAGGDCVSGPSTVVEAVAAGQRAAVSIDCFLREVDFEGYKRPRPRAETDRIELTAEDEKLLRVKMSELMPDVRSGNFDEVELGLEERQAMEEARRCLRCDLSG